MQDEPIDKDTDEIAPVETVSLTDYVYGRIGGMHARLRTVENGIALLAGAILLLCGALLYHFSENEKEPAK